MIKRLYDNFEEIFCALSVLVMVACLIAQVLLRAINGSALAWTEELSRYSFLWTVYMAAALTAKRNGHVRVTAQFLFFSIKTRLVLRMLADTVWVVFNLYIAWQCRQTIRAGMEFPEVSPTLGIMKYWVEMIVPAGFVLLSFRVVEDYVKRWKKGTLRELVREETD